MDSLEDKVFKAEQRANLLEERIRMLEERLANVTGIVREEVVRTLGITFAQTADSLLNASAAGHKYTAVVISDTEPANPQTFYAERTEEGWRYHVMNNDAIQAFSLKGLIAPMREAIERYIAEVPTGVTATAFNVYKDKPYVH